MKNISTKSFFMIIFIIGLSLNMSAQTLTNSNEELVQGQSISDMPQNMTPEQTAAWLNDYYEFQEHKAELEQEAQLQQTISTPGFSLFTIESEELEVDYNVYRCISGYIWRSPIYYTICPLCGNPVTIIETHYKNGAIL